MLLVAGSLCAQTSDELFDTNVLHEIRLTIHPQDWQRLKETFTENTYYPCNLEWRGIMAENIGIRSRGLGSRSGTKPGLRVDFDRFETNQEFLGLKSVVLDNLTQDNSFIRERLSMEMFRRMGIPAPRVTHARLYVNDAYAGLYGLVESIDKRFLRRHFSQNDGYLYEYKWTFPYRFEYRGPETASYSPAPFQPQTNESSPDAAPLEAMVRVMNQASDSEFIAAISEYLDLRMLVQQLAIENYISEPDGILGDDGLNNFYLYRFEGGRRHQFIPWDKDVAFSGPDRPLFRRVDENVLARRTLAVPEFRTLYLETLARAAEAAGGAGGWLQSEVDRIYLQIRDAAIEDTFKPAVNEEFEGSINYLKYFVPERQTFVQTELPKN
jgi:spore coat protein CotH